MSLPALVAGAPIPRDARIIALIMYSMGITDADPAVLLQLLEFAHRYTHDVLQDALVYSDHAASRSTGAATGNLSLEDIQLAIQSRVNYSFTHPPPKDVLVSLAASINSIPLPAISDRVGIRLPPLEHCLTNVNFSIVPNSPPRSPSPEVKPEPRHHHHQTSTTANGTGPTRNQQADESRNGAPDEDVGMQDGTGASGLPASDSTGSRWQQDDNYDDAPAPPGAAPLSLPPSRGTKRALDEDEDYD
ncbi:unnamed protein product [Tilletia controversa]|uniref:Transcription initiation factor TFIID subunit 9 n=3 Tax=Tilletia TaxID=13289 RepID=A0A8X7MNX2_9BASI|nr:hypothetical protein CF336_g7739 [Tilletia laevis]KAE8186063.1 hypothetical protein CF328_g7350 [Tilletia controversa]KAE8245831.1 hypothetical protein A4X03_0g7406 [Tilletia caries]KAE8186421.1 hypothetical protein CF335_g7450 [Tilletia laevis]KAE8242298.1 hypothetical protein A4X06_0g7040 [Tilletia controversa]